VGKQSRPHGPAIFDVMFDKPGLLAPPRRTGEVGERVDFTGRVLRALDEAALRRTVRQLAAEGVESVAVCLLFSFLHPAHELRVREIIQEEMPGCGVSLSCDILPQIREYHRLSTTVINAYLQPILARYIARLDGRLAEAGIATRRKYIMQSNGGTSTFEAAARKAVTTVLSGPAGGVTAGTYICRATGFANIITFDMGGTSCDVALIRDGQASVTPRGHVEGRDIAVPMMDINTVSAGGGTLARVDRYGTLEVGPQSAGAMPGPACYGRGGDQPTITDCNLQLGLLSPDNFLGGKMRLDAAAAAAAIENAVARPLKIPLDDAAEGVLRIIDVKMAEAIKAISTMRGHDLRDFMLLAFGGAGPVHACRIARDLEMAGVIVPLYPGVFSAMGLMMSDVKHDYVQSRMGLLSESSSDAVEAMFKTLLAQADEELRADGFGDADIVIERAIDMRYAGQGYEITMHIDAGRIDLAGLRRQFDQRHRAMFGHAAPEEPVELVSYRVRGVGRVPPVAMLRFKPQGGTLADALRETRAARFDGVSIDCPVYRRDRLDVGVVVPGPAILDQFDCTTILCAGQVARVDEWKNLIVTRELGP
jgi:N-methylhydantoinase A